MKQTIIIISIFLLILSSNTCVALNHGAVCFKKHCFYVELAQTADERSQGLMFRSHLDSDKGMLFIFTEEGKYSFGMKDVLIPLDIIWINKDKEVVFIREGVQPCMAEPCTTIKPNVMAKYVLELNARTAEEIGLSVGDKLEFDID